jgi:hypothetical protein
MPLQMIEGAIRMGKKIMRKCSKRKNTLRIALMQPRIRWHSQGSRSQDKPYLAMITATSVNIQADTQGAMDTAHQAIESMQTRLDTYHNETADILLDIIKPSIQNIPDEIIAKLREQGIVSSKQDCMDQIREIQKDPDLTELKNEQLLQWALQVSLPPSKSPTKDKMETRLTCQSAWTI